MNIRIADEAAVENLYCCGVAEQAGQIDLHVAFSQERLDSIGLETAGAGGIECPGHCPGSDFAGSDVNIGQGGELGRFYATGQLPGRSVVHIRN